MKIKSASDRDRPARRRSGQRGMATVVFIALLAIMMVLVMVESSSLVRLHRELKLLEQHQMKRLAGPPNTPAVAVNQEVK